MSFFRSFKKRLTNQFVAIVIEEKVCKIKQKIVKNGEIDLIEETFFDISSKDELSGEVVSFLNELQENCKHTYIALFLNTSGQGVIPGCDESKLEKYNVDKNNIKTVCVNNKYLAYASNIDIKWLDKTFNKVGIDFIFSPFLVLDFYRKNYESSNDPKLYILNTESTFTMMIIKENDLLFGSFFNIAKEDNLLYTDYEGETQSVDEEFEKFDQIEIDEKLEDDIVDESGDESLAEETHVLDNNKDNIHFFEKDARYIRYLSAALKEFYSSELYEGDFIESVKVFDDNDMSKDIVDYMQDQLLLDVSLEKINIKNAVIELASKEVFG